MFGSTQCKLYLCRNQATRRGKPGDKMQSIFYKHSINNPLTRVQCFADITCNWLVFYTYIHETKIISIFSRNLDYLFKWDVRVAMANADSWQRMITHGILLLCRKVHGISISDVFVVLHLMMML